MKKIITREQWEELDLNQVDKWFSVSSLLEKYIKSNDYPSIGDMIEFLGNDFNRIEYKKEYMSALFTVYTYTFSKGEYVIEDYEELVDALWQAVKYKLKQ